MVKSASSAVGSGIQTLVQTLLHAIFVRSPHGHLRVCTDSAKFVRSAHGLRQVRAECTRTPQSPCGLRQTPYSPRGVHKDPWGSVKYWKIGPIDSHNFGLCGIYNLFILMSNVCILHQMECV